MSSARAAGGCVEAASVATVTGRRLEGGHRHERRRRALATPETPARPARTPRPDAQPLSSRRRSRPRPSHGVGRGHAHAAILLEARTSPLGSDEDILLEDILLEEDVAVEEDVHSESDQTDPVSSARPPTTNCAAATPPVGRDGPSAASDQRGQMPRRRWVACAASPFYSRARARRREAARRP